MFYAIIIFLLIFSINLTAQTNSISSGVYNKIAFSRQESQNDWDIWIMELDGSNQIRIHNSTSNDADPHFRFDGSKIVFSRFIQGSPPTQDIYTINPDGTNLTNLTGDIPAEVSRPKWSWDGTKIVFCVTVGIDNRDIYIMNSNGSNKTALITGTNNDEWPSFSPDGAYIVFQRIIGPVQNQKAKICRYKISDGSIIDLTDGNNLDEMPIYSPDGNYIIFKRGTANPEIYRLEISNLSLTNLTNNSVVDDAPMYSYDGSKIAWMQSTTGISTSEIWIMNSDGTNKVRLTNNSVADFNPTFSPISSTSIKIDEKFITKKFELNQNYPNPFNPSTTITFTLAEDGLTTLKIYDVLGREVQTLVSEELKAGQIHRVKFDGSKLVSGIYFYKLESKDKSMIRKFVLMK